MARQEALRTTFAVVDGSPLQVISPTLDVPLPVEDLSEPAGSGAGGSGAAAGP